MIVLDNMGAGFPAEWMLDLAPFIGILLPLLVWIYMYRQGAEARDLIFWGVIIVVIPLLGPLAAVVYMRRRGKPKRHVADEGG